MDIVGPLPRTANGNEYILVFCDHFTKWVECYALPDHQAQTVADAMVSNFISRFGVPSVIHSDQRRRFESRLFEEVCQLLGIEKTRTTPYHPQSDGLVERFNRTLQQMLSAFVNKERDNWHEHFPYVVMAYRATVHESTKFSPNRLMLGHKTNLPLDLLVGPLPNSKKNTCYESMSSGLQGRWKILAWKHKLSLNKQRSVKREIMTKRSFHINFKEDTGCGISILLKQNKN